MLSFLIRPFRRFVSSVVVMFAGVQASLGCKGLTVKDCRKYYGTRQLSSYRKAEVQ